MKRYGLQMFKEDEGEWVKWVDLRNYFAKEDYEKMIHDNNMVFLAEAEQDFEEAKEVLHEAARRLNAARAVVDGRHMG